MQEHYVNRLTIYSGELQQIWEQPAHTTILGTRIQYGHFDTANLQNTPSRSGFIFPPPRTCGGSGHHFPVQAHQLLRLPSMADF